MSSILLYGGAFNPPTNAHLSIIKACLQLDYDEVWVVPSGTHPWAKVMAPGHQRYRWLQACLPQHAKLVLSDEELKRPIASWYEFLTRMRDRHPGSSFTSVIGADQAANLPRWTNGAHMCRNESWVILSRPGSPDSYSHISHHRHLVMESSPVSSTSIRHALKNGLEPQGLPQTLQPFIHDIANYA